MSIQPSMSRNRRAMLALSSALAALTAATLALSGCAGPDPRVTAHRNSPQPKLVAAETPNSQGVVFESTFSPAGGSSVHYSQSTDHAAPVISSASWTPTIYPVRDGYRDSFVVSGTTNERTWATLVVRNRENQLVRRVSVVHGTGRMTIAWNGRLASGRVAPAGSYRWYVSWHDAAGNEQYSAWRTLTVSHRHLVTRTSTITVHGDAYWKAGGSDPSCSQASKHGSFYTHGVWLSNNCSGAIAAAFYRIRVPAAVSYRTIAVQAWGFTDYAGTRVYRAYGSKGGSGSFVSGRFTSITDTRHRLHSFGSSPAASKVSADHHLILAISVDDRPTSKRDFDLRYLRLRLTYRVLG